MGALTLHQVGSTFSRDTDVVQHSRYAGISKAKVAELSTNITLPSQIAYACKARMSTEQSIAAHMITA